MPRALLFDLRSFVGISVSPLPQKSAQMMTILGRRILLLISSPIVVDIVTDERESAAINCGLIRIAKRHCWQKDCLLFPVDGPGPRRHDNDEALMIVSCD